MNNIWCSQRLQSRTRTRVTESSSEPEPTTFCNGDSKTSGFSGPGVTPVSEHFPLTASQDSPWCSSHPLPHMLKAHLHLSDPLAPWKAVGVTVRFPQTTQMYFLSLSSCVRYPKFPPSLVALCWGLSSLSASHVGLTQLDTGHRHVAGPCSACCSSSGSLAEAACLPACSW